MSLSLGARLGPYEVLSLLGAGGMGEVYRARDTKLGRDVAIKILPELFISDPGRVARFEREAQLLAALNHPHIAAIYGLEESGGSRFLVLELIDGESLAERLARGPVEMPEALAIARQIVDALEAAHEKGIVHRDLKPANLMLTAEDQVKVLDFGLAKALEGDARSDLAHSPTVTFAGTEAGVILGTAAYMSPEQAKGRVADKRSDVWAFGCVLYEMLAGKRAFEGEDVSDTLAAILRGEPDWNALPRDVSAPIRTLIRRCLEKDRKARIPDISVVRFLMMETEHASGGIGTVVPAAMARSNRAAWGIAGVLALGLVPAAIIVVRHLREAPRAADVIQFTIPPPEESLFANIPQFAVSPDGRHVAFVATSTGAPMLWIRSLDTVSARLLPGTDQVSYPFWSPDSRAVAFFAGGKLKKVQVAGGPPAVISDEASGRGGTWNGDNIILFGPLDSGPIQRVSAGGGTPTAATTLDTAQNENAHGWPYFLPDGRHFLYLSMGGGQRPSEVKLRSLDSNEVTSIVATDSNVAYGSGHLVFWRDGSVMAQPFDIDARQLKGDPFPVAEPVAHAAPRASFSVSTTGVLVYSRGGTPTLTRLTWMDRTGRQLGTVGDPSQYFNITLSPDERRVAASLVPNIGGDRDIWVIDLARAVSSRLTFEPGVDAGPAWSPDGSRIAFSSNRSTGKGLYQMSSSGEGQAQLLMKMPGVSLPTDWSRDGRLILYSITASKTGGDLWIVPVLGDAKPYPLLQTTFNETNGEFSPDVRWIAYSSDESGHEEVYVQPFPPTGATYQISRIGGTQPMWRGDTKELYFLMRDGTMMSATINTAGGFNAGIPKALFASGVTNFANRHQYAVTRDGKRFLIVAAQQGSSSPSLTVVMNWPVSAAR